MRVLSSAKNEINGGFRKVENYKLSEKLVQIYSEKVRFLGRNEIRKNVLNKNRKLEIV